MNNLSKSLPLQAGILAGGHGQRIRALQGVPKVMFKICGEPLIMWSIRTLRKVGFKNILCITNSSAKKLVDDYLVLHEERNIKLIVANTRSALYSFHELIKALKKTDFIFINVDTLLNHFNLQNFVQAYYHIPKCDILLGITDHVEDESPVYLDVDSNFRVTKLGSDFINSKYITAGVYAGSYKISQSINSAISEDIHTLRGYLEWLVNSGYNVYAYPLGEVIDVDRPIDVDLAELFLSKIP